MKQTKRLWAALLALVLLAGCGYQRTEPLPYPEPAASEPGKTIAYVPLDDRPDNVERVEYLAESLGYALVMPEKVLYRTALASRKTLTLSSGGSLGPCSLGSLSRKRRGATAIFFPWTRCTPGDWWPPAP